MIPEDRCAWCGYAFALPSSTASWWAMTLFWMMPEPVEGLWPAKRNAETRIGTSADPSTRRYRALILTPFVRGIRTGMSTSNPSTVVERTATGTGQFVREDEASLSCRAGQSPPASSRISPRARRRSLLPRPHDGDWIPGSQAGTGRPPSSVVFGRLYERGPGLLQGPQLDHVAAEEQGDRPVHDDPDLPVRGRDAQHVVRAMEEPGREAPKPQPGDAGDPLVSAEGDELAEVPVAERLERPASEGGHEVLG